MDAHMPETYVARLAAALDRMGRYLTSTASTYLEEIPGPMLSGSQRKVLRTLVDKGPCQVSEVANQLRVTLSAATGLVDRLVKAKLVTRDRDQRDRRVVWVKVTPDGEAAVAGAERRRERALSQLVAHLPEEDLHTLCSILERIDNP